MKIKPITLEKILSVIVVVICSRTVLVSLDDPEGPNLLVVSVLASFIYVSAWIIIRLADRWMNKRIFFRTTLFIVLQVFVDVVLYYFLK